MDKIKLTFTNAFEGRAAGPNGEVLIGSQPGLMKPYHLLFSALGLTFLRRFFRSPRRKEVDVLGAVVELTRKQENPGPLRQVTIDVIFDERRETVMRSVELGLHCSIHETVSRLRILISA